VAKRLQVEFPEGNPGLKLDVIGAGKLDNDATQYDAILRLAFWARSSIAGVENRTLLAGKGPICVSLAPWGRDD
jgi:hypothetical protein